MKTQIPLTVDRRFGSLTVKRIMDDGLIFTTCTCGGSRMLTRRQLTGGAVTTCVRCANANRRKARPRVEPPVPPAPIVTQEKKRPVCTAFCVGRLIDGRWMVAHNPDCPRLGLFAIKPGTAQRIDTRVYPATE